MHAMPEFYIVKQIENHIWFDFLDNYTLCSTLYVLAKKKSSKLVIIL